MLKYTELVLDHFKNPRNLGKIENADAEATEGSIACGDMMTVYLKVEDDRITDIKFESYGCAANIATASMMTEVVKGLTLEEAKKLSWKEIVERLGGLPQVKYHCSNLAVDTLRKAIKEYEESLARK
ncbi:iron-sulfur cluster assembly scaffold protein [Pseudothermotoga lettingae]|jgi:nitrogen fixation NifU-like protein|uniref:iron-sulfur cluster assembly scaffold protein n=1 Tax=Pseudothermotoga lettingae TaxID=177758 RepID=UPI000746E80A|nr:iron-sulfur cluster assembly scaffold protein [Pseudothermotoga lettingae]KUK21920.1 MAG: Nitrogen-fixing NifU domain protein [Pseudothermotoga lettingae]